MQSIINFIEKYPRTYYSFTFFFLPHLVLNVLLCLAFGSLIAYFETSAEQTQNDLVYADSYLESNIRNNANSTIETGPEFCVRKFLADNGIDINDNTTSDNIDFNKMIESVSDCGNNLRDEYGLSASFFLDEVPSINDVSFGFTKCPYKGLIDEPYSKFKPLNYMEYTQAEWKKSFNDWKDYYVSEGKNESEAVEYARTNATGHKDCEMNYIGGAVYFFTVLTTIGYGNHIVSTNAGRAIVYICGFASILIFTATSATAGTVFTMIFDDYAIRLNYPSLTKGLTSIFVWFGLFVCSMCSYAAVIQGYSKTETPEGVSYDNALWHSFVTFTTIGFGDIPIPQEDFTFGWFIVYVMFEI